MKYTCLLLVCILSCATGSDEPAGGGKNLPSIHVLPCEIPENSIVIEDEGQNYAHPWAHRGTHGELVIWSTIDGSIVRSDRPNYMMSPELPWENESIGEPALLTLKSDAWLMTYVGDSNAGIGLASSTDYATWNRTSNPVLEPIHPWEKMRVSSPSLVNDNAQNRLLLFYVGGDGDGIGAAESHDNGESFQRLTDGPLLARSEDEFASEFSKAPISGASCDISFSPLNRKLYECYFSASGNIGYTAGFTLEKFYRFELNPFLQADGLNMADPMRLENTLFFSRNRKVSSPTSGRVIGLAKFGVQ